MVTLEHHSLNFHTPFDAVWFLYGVMVFVYPKNADNV
jgi:hypothetical protein